MARILTARTRRLLHVQKRHEKGNECCCKKGTTSWL